MATMRTLFLNPPSFEGFDGGAGARYQARREIKSFWYPTWLAQPAALIPTSKLIDAPADDLTLDQVLQRARGFELCIIHTSTPSFDNDAKVADALKKQNPDMKIGFVGAHVAVLPGESLKNAPVLDFVGREEFDYTIKEVAEGRPLEQIAGLSFRKADGEIVHNPDRMLIDDMDALPSVLDVYKRDLVVPNYYIGYLKHPYLSIYTGRGCPARCSFCLWPQTVGGHVYRTKSAKAVIAEMAKAKEMFPEVAEFFFDDDTFTADLTRAAEIAKGLGKLGIMWSCNSRANVHAGKGPPLQWRHRGVDQVRVPPERRHHSGLLGRGLSRNRAVPPGDDQQVVRRGHHGAQRRHPGERHLLSPSQRRRDGGGVDDLFGGDRAQYRILGSNRV